jgi:hypothetical protein
MQILAARPEKLGGRAKSDTIVAAIKQEQTSKVLKLLAENKNGLTSHQIDKLVGERIRRDILLNLKKEGVVRQKKGITADGTICMLYVTHTKRQVELAQRESER